MIHFPLQAATDYTNAFLGLCHSIRDAGVDEKQFFATLDRLSEEAFDDQCTGTNPRYPLISEIKQLYANAYYGDCKAV